MITITGVDQHAAWQARTMPAVEQIRDGVWSIPVTFPNNPIRYTLCYLLVGDGDALVIDPGWNSDAGWIDLCTGLRAAGLGPGDVTGIVVTHSHPDHWGLARRLREASGAWVALGEGEEGLPARPDADILANDRTMMRVWGVPADRLDAVTMSTAGVAAYRAMAAPDVVLSSHDAVPVRGLDVRAVLTPGHSAGHVCLVDGTHGLVFTGDHILPRISPHVSLFAHGLANPLARYFESLRLIAGADRGPQGPEVCPAHEYRFTGLAARAAALEEHHLERSAEVGQVVADADPATVWDVARRLTWSRGWDALDGFSLRLALCETASHLAWRRSTGHDEGPDLGPVAGSAASVPARCAE